jgi:hypothetical protein
MPKSLNPQALFTWPYWKRAAVVEHETDPAVIAERRRRRLCDLLPSLFDTVRSFFATSKSRVSTFPVLLEQVVGPENAACHAILHVVNLRFLSQME